jgi:hypothetical protein
MPPHLARQAAARVLSKHPTLILQPPESRPTRAYQLSVRHSARPFVMDGGVAMLSACRCVSGLVSGMPNSHIHTRTCMMISLTTSFMSELQLAICQALYMHSTPAMKSAGRSSHASKQLNVAAAADSCGDAVCSACAIFSFPIESSTTANAMPGTREDLVMRVEFVMIEKASVGALTLWRGLPF